MGWMASKSKIAEDLLARKLRMKKMQAELDGVGKAVPAATGGGGGGAAGGAGGGAGGASGALAKARAMYAPGGAYESGLNASLARGSKKAVAQGTQSLVSSGLASTSMGASLGKQYEEEVGAPARANLESRRTEAMAGLYSQEAGMDFQSSEAAAGRQFASAEADKSRAFTSAQNTANQNSPQMSMASMLGAGPQTSMAPGYFGRGGAPAPTGTAAPAVKSSMIQGTPSGPSGFVSKLKSLDTSWDF